MIAALHHRLVGGDSYAALGLIRLFLGVHLSIKGLLAWRYHDYLFGPASFAQPISMTYLQDFDPLMRGLAAPLGILHIVAALLLAAGLGGRLTAAAVLLTMDALQSLNMFVLNGGDSLSRYLLFYVLVGESYVRFSLRPRKRPAAGSWGEALTAAATSSIGLHLSLIYAVSGLAKVASSEMWQNGTALYYILHQERFMATEVGATLMKLPWVTTIATYGVLAFEIYFPCLIWTPRAKMAATAVGVLLHLSIAGFMMIYDFQLIFLYAYLALWSDTDLAAVARWARRKFESVTAARRLPGAEPLAAPGTSIEGRR